VGGVGGYVGIYGGRVWKVGGYLGQEKDGFSVESSKFPCIVLT
jgi:hypothetical protein